MKKHIQDIYETSRHDRTGEMLTDRTDVTGFALPWITAARRHTHANIIISIVLVTCTIAIISAIVWYEQKARYHVRPNWRMVEATPSATSSQAADDSLDARTMLLLDELAAQPLFASAAKPGEPLDVQMLKQATYHIIQAERSERQQEYAQALHHYERAQITYPDMRGLQKRLGMLCLRLNDYARALEHFEKTLIEEPISAGLANNIGICHMGLEQYSRAIGQFQTAIRLDPNYALAYFNLAMLNVRTGELEAAVPVFEKYLTLKPEDISATQTYALTLIELKRWRDALPIWERLSREAPEIAPVHFRLAQTYAQLRNVRGALQAIQRGASLVDVPNVLSWMARPEFDPIRNEPEFQNLSKQFARLR